MGMRENYCEVSVQIFLCTCRLQDYPVADVGANDVAVDMMMCAINPADINQIQGESVKLYHIT